MKDAQYWIEKLNLKRHPEGGYYRETYRSSEIIKHAALPERFHGPRVFSTAIYFLLSGAEVSHLHRIKSDEIWHFYAGSSLMIHVIDLDGSYQKIKLGLDVDKGEAIQVVVHAGCWFGAELEELNSFCLVGCTVAPGFDFEDFELGGRNDLLQSYPQHHAIIRLLTKPS
jgi:predicted cupin superfamily sugar epimerase